MSSKTEVTPISDEEFSAAMEQESESWRDDLPFTLTGAYLSHDAFMFTAQWGSMETHIMEGDDTVHKTGALWDWALKKDRGPLAVTLAPAKPGVPVKAVRLSGNRCLVFDCRVVIDGLVQERNPTPDMLRFNLGQPACERAGLLDALIIEAIKPKPSEDESGPYLLRARQRVRPGEPAAGRLWHVLTTREVIRKAPNPELDEDALDTWDAPDPKGWCTPPKPVIVGVEFSHYHDSQGEPGKPPLVLATRFHQPDILSVDHLL